MPKMVCPDCERELVPLRSGVTVVEMFNDPPQPYKIWSADLWCCPKCNRSTIAGFCNEPIAEHYEPDFEKFLAVARVRGNVFYSYER